MRRDLLIHPAFTAPLALLALNDHVFKALVPGAITGKISDFAGVFVVSILIFVATGRRATALVLTTLGFGAIKVSATAAVLAAPFLGGRTLQDPTDLVALLALVPSSALMTRYPQGQGSPSALRSSVILASGAAVVITITATSCDGDPGVAAFSVHGDRLFARIDDPNQETESWAMSTDGGLTWDNASPPPANAPEFKSVCTADGRCFRVIPGERVELKDRAGDWHTSFSFSDEESRRLELRTTECVGEVKTFGAVAIAEVGNEEHVVVAMGAQGILRRESSGAWERHQVLGLEPVPLVGPSWMSKLPAATLLLALVSPLFVLVGRRRGRREKGINAFVVSLAGGSGLLMLSGMLFFFAVDYVIVGGLIVILCVLVLIASIVIAMNDDPANAPPPPGPPRR